MLEVGQCIDTKPNLPEFRLDTSPFDKYIGFAELAVNAWSSQALESILRVVAVVPEHLVSKYMTRMDWIKV